MLSYIFSSLVYDTGYGSKFQPITKTYFPYWFFI